MKPVRLDLALIFGVVVVRRVNRFGSEGGIRRPLRSPAFWSGGERFLWAGSSRHVIFANTPDTSGASNPRHAPRNRCDQPIRTHIRYHICDQGEHKVELRVWWHVCMQLWDGWMCFWMAAVKEKLLLLCAHAGHVLWCCYMTTLHFFSHRTWTNALPPPSTHLACGFQGYAQCRCCCTDARSWTAAASCIPVYSYFPNTWVHVWYVRMCTYSRTHQLYIAPQRCEKF